MKTLIKFGFVSLVILFFLQQAEAQVVVAEDFNYPTGSLGGQWSAICSGALVNVESPGLAYPGYAGSGTGNAASLVASGSEYKLTSNFSITGSVYTSFLINVESIQTGGGGTCSQGNDFVMAYRASGGAGQNFNLHTGLILKRIDSSHFVFGIEGPVSGQIVTTNVYDINTTYLVVLALDQTNYYIYVNPPLDGSPVNPDVIYPTGTTYSSIDNIVLGQNSYGHFYIDGMLITSNLYDIIQDVLSPEPLYPPANLTFANVTSSGLVLSYSPGLDNPNSSLVVRNPGASISFTPTDGDGYSIDQNVGNGDTISQASGCCTTTEAGLMPETKYFYRVFSANQTGDNSTINYLTSPILEGSQFTLSLEPAPAPVSFTASGASATEINLNFSAASTIGNADGYIILRRLDGTAPTFSGLVDGIPPSGLTYPQGTSLLTFINAGGVTFFADNGLAPNTLYHYAIIPVNWDGMNPETFNYRTSGVIKTTSSYTRTLAPTALAGTLATQNKFTACWNRTAGASSYSLDVSTDNFSTFVGSYHNLAVPDTLQLVTGLSAGVIYQYRVRAINSAGLSSYSNVVSVPTITLSPTGLVVSQTLSTGFVINWSAVSGAVDHYEVDVSANDFVSFISGYNAVAVGANTNFKGISNLSPSTLYQFRVRAVNSSGASDNSTSAAYTLTNSGQSYELQVASLTFPAYITPSTSGEIITQLSNVGTALVDVLFYHKKITESTFSSDTIRQTNNKYALTVGPGMLDELGMEFYFYASDDYGRKDSTAHYKIYRSFDGPSSPVFISGAFTGTYKDYRIVAVPYLLTDNLIETVVENTLGAYDVSKWRFGHYQSGQVQEYGNGINRIERGLGYWFNAKDQDALVIQTGAGSTAGNDEANPFTMTLSKGWNQVGNPYPFAIKWSDVLAANSSAAGVGTLKIFEGGSFMNGDLLLPFTGGFVFSENNTSLSIPVSLRTNAIGKIGNSIASPDLGNEEWQVTLSVVQGEKINHLGGFGMHPLAKASKDEFDDLTIPRFGEYVEVRHSHPDYFYPYFSRDIIPPASKHIWKFMIETSEEGSETSLIWDNAALGTGESMLFLLDEENGQVINMKERSSYSFISGRAHEFQVFFSKTSEGVVQFDSNLLGDAFPNPFAGSTSIPFVLSEAQSSYSVELSVLDLLGRKSRTLIARQLAPGYYNTTWDGVGDQGDAQPAGVYIYRLTVDGKSFAKRFIME